MGAVWKWLEMFINSCKWWKWGWCVVVGNVTTEESGMDETQTSEEDLPEDFFDFEDSDSDKPEEGLDEENPVFSSESESELPEI